MSTIYVIDYTSDTIHIQARQKPEIKIDARAENLAIQQRKGSSLWEVCSLNRSTSKTAVLARFHTKRDALAHMDEISPRPLEYFTSLQSALASIPDEARRRMHLAITL